MTDEQKLGVEKFRGITSASYQKLRQDACGLLALYELDRAGRCPVDAMEHWCVESSKYAFRISAMPLKDAWQQATIAALNTPQETP